MIKVGIVGATGYAGAELVRILLRHPQAEIKKLISKSYTGQRFSSIYGNVQKLVEKDCDGDDLKELSRECDVIFTATPQGYLSGLLTDDILDECRVIDLSADYRLEDVDTYEKWYGLKHGSPELIKRAVYGLCELHRRDIKNKRLVANPGCYTTCSILALYPLVAQRLIDTSTIIVDAKSGTSGAGRGAKVSNLFCEVNESIKPYGVSTHRHTPEIEQMLSEACGEPVMISFTPHLVPMNRGILVTAYATLRDGVSAEAVEGAFNDYYGNEYFIRLLPGGICPETKWVEGSNFTDIGFVIDERTGRIIVMSALDNLVKGAAGQAVQNMNLIFDLCENEGLDLVPAFP